MPHFSNLRDAALHPELGSSRCAALYTQYQTLVCSNCRFIYLSNTAALHCLGNTETFSVFSVNTNSLGLYFTSLDLGLGQFVKDKGSN